jgi:hypothetical protein
VPRSDRLTGLAEEGGYCDHRSDLLGWPRNTKPATPSVRTHENSCRGKSPLTPAAAALLLHVARDPICNDASNFEIVLLQHHHVTVAMDAFIGQPDETILYTGLRQVF